jgi:ADP-ribose pyrophosphatase YjhB (NUDIX family)
MDRTSCHNLGGFRCWGDTHVWGLPGGLSPPSEPLRETVRRELQEEAGLEVEVGDLALVAENFWGSRLGRRKLPRADLCLARSR